MDSIPFWRQVAFERRLTAGRSEVAQNLTVIMEQDGFAGFPVTGRLDADCEEYRV
ncbi:MAG: hypothetical protein WD355_02515 [Balneolaceae bacterium]